MAGRLIAIGDIHGCSKALIALVEIIEPIPEDTIIILGDFIDRGPDSCGVINGLIALAQCCQLIPLFGDHEEMMVNAQHDNTALRKWLICGGTETLQSYGAGLCVQTAKMDMIPEHHRAFIRNCRLYYETRTHIFVHGNFLPDLPMDQQQANVLLWRVSHAESSVPHYSGKVAIVGHTAQRSGEVLDLRHLVCIDTNCVRGGWLTAFEVGTGTVWQADSKGRLREWMRNSLPGKTRV